jgi:osmotically-inducible protein OsmY
MRSRRTQVSVIVTATLAALACSDEGLDLGTHDDEGREYAARDSGAMPAEADNTGRNIRDRDPSAVTPTDQSNSEQDIDLAQRIRSGITSVEQMSMQARNVKVISRDGVVTLRGPVESEQEKATIEMLARNAGAVRIESQLEIDRDADSGWED